MEPQKNAEFPPTKPLPPIGVSSSENHDSEQKSSGTDRSENSRRADDEKSTTSSTGFDRQGEGSARPRVVRGFRPERFSDDEMDEDDTPRSQRFIRRTYDGRELTFVTLDTQTDWDWLEHVEMTGTARTLTRRDPKAKEEKEKLPASPKSASSKPDPQDEKGDPYQYQMPYSDEYGIPILDLSSDTDDKTSDSSVNEEKWNGFDGLDRGFSSDEEISHKKVKDDRKFIPSVGPPNILQNDSDRRKASTDSDAKDAYQRESEKHDINAEDPEARIEGEDFDKDAEGIVHGMFTGKCEFCQKDIKPFPTMEQQLKYPPESLYCCSEYRDFVEFVLVTNTEMEEEVKRKNKLINIKPHEHVGSKQERNAAKEKAVQRMRERELQRRQQEASGMAQNFFASGGSSKAGFPKNITGLGALTMKDMFDQMPHNAASDLDPNCLQIPVKSRGTAPSGTATAASKAPKAHKAPVVATGAKGPIEGAIAAPQGPGLLVPSVGTTSSGTASAELKAPKAHKTPVATGAKGPAMANGSTEGAIAAPSAPGVNVTPVVARQMKTINYQLSSQKCLEEGWTLRAPSPMTDELGDDVFIPEPLNPDMIEDGRLRDRPLIEKFYESGQKFLTMFPDGTGNVFYPSGNLAILVSAVKLGQFFYTIHRDVKRSGVVAAFEPNGFGYCYFPNGEVRLYIDQYGGIELDAEGGKKRKWSWKDQVTHIHAPPFQPICIGLNRHMGVRVMTQENIALTFSASQRSCRFNMGARLKVVAPENAPLKEVEEDHIFLEEKKNLVGSILDKVSNLLKFPNHPKLDKMLPPLHISSKATKTEKLKKERQSFLAQQSAREKKQAPVSVN